MKKILNALPTFLALGAGLMVIALVTRNQKILYDIDPSLPGSVIMLTLFLMSLSLLFGATKKEKNQRR